MVYERPIPDSYFENDPTLNSAQKEIYIASEIKHLVMNGNVVGTVHRDVIGSFVVSENGIGGRQIKRRHVRLKPGVSVAHTKWWRHHKNSYKRASKLKKGEKMFNVDARFVDWNQAKAS